MMTSSNGNIFRVTDPLCGEFTGPGEFPTQRPVTRSFDVFFDLRLNKRLSKQLWGWWFETPSWSLWHQCNGWGITYTNANYLQIGPRGIIYLQLNMIHATAIFPSGQFDQTQAAVCEIRCPPLSKLMLTYHRLDRSEQKSVTFELKH